MAASNKDTKTSKLRSNKLNLVKEQSQQAGITISSTIHSVQLQNKISEDSFSYFETALFQLLSKYNSTYELKSDEKSLLDNFTSSRKFNIKSLLNLDEWIEGPVFLHFGNSLSDGVSIPRLFVEGLPPDIAWKLQELFDSWHKSDPILFPKVRLSIFNMRLKFDNEKLNLLYQFFENIYDFDRIFSLKDIFDKSEMKDLFPEEITISLFKNHLDIYLKKDFKEFKDVQFEVADDISKSHQNIVMSNSLTLNSIAEVIKPKVMLIIEKIIDKSIKLGFDEIQSQALNQGFIDKFGISSVIRSEEISNLRQRYNDLFLKLIPSSEPKIKDITSDLDVLHYIRSLVNTNISIEELLTTGTKFMHVEELFQGSYTDNSYRRALKSTFSITNTRYFLENYNMFHIRKLDLSTVKLIVQPNMEILAELKHLRTLILDNAIASGDFDITKIEFGKFTELEILFVRNCSLTKLTRSMFIGASKLKKVYATNNTIQSIEEDCFKDVPIDELQLDPVPSSSFSKDIVELIENTKNTQDRRKKQLFAAYNM